MRNNHVSLLVAAALSLSAALSGATDVLSVTDKRGNETFVPSAKIAYVELGSAAGNRSIGFGG